MVCLDIHPYQKYIYKHQPPPALLPHLTAILIFLLFTHSPPKYEKELPSSFHVFICVCLAVLYYCASI